MIPKPPTYVATITDTAALEAAVAWMRSRSWLAIDTEFLRERTYHPRLCLVQIADTQKAVVVDVLAIDDLSALADLLIDPAVRKVFHSAEQDLEVLRHTFGALPHPIFDTQLAGPLIGLDDQMGYARTIEALLGVKLAKAHTRTDWSRRPLADGALEYAADDVRYLAVVYPLIQDALVNKQRADWALEDADRLAAPERYEPNIDGAWRRIKAWIRLAPRAQQILAEIAAWREHEALASDRPRRWILSDDLALALSEEAPADDIALADISGLPEKTREKHGDALLAAIERGCQRPAEVLDPDAGPPDGPTKRAIKAGMEALKDISERLDIPPGVLASRSDVAALVAGRDDVRLRQGWRRDIAGEHIAQAIEAARAQRDSPHN